VNEAQGTFLRQKDDTVSSSPGREGKQGGSDRGVSGVTLATPPIAKFARPGKGSEKRERKEVTVQVGRPPYLGASDQGPERNSNVSHVAIVETMEWKWEFKKPGGKKEPGKTKRRTCLTGRLRKEKKRKKNLGLIDTLAHKRKTIGFQVKNRSRQKRQWNE